MERVVNRYFIEGKAGIVQPFLSLQPVASGTVLEATRRLKLSVKRVINDSGKSHLSPRGRRAGFRYVPLKLRRYSALGEARRDWGQVVHA